jgi:FkbM family methyltransferase
MKLVEGIWLPDGDTHFQAHLEQGPRFAEAGSYQMRKIEAALDSVHPKRRKLAVDVGGHVGLWSRVLAASFERVVAFEPMPHLATCFRRNLEACENVDLRECAVTDVAGTSIDLVRDDANSGNCRVALPGEFSMHQVAAVRLDDCELDGVSFIKIDVEGWELAVVRGGEGLIKEFKPVMVVEQKKGHGVRYGLPTDDAAVRLLQSWGAKVQWIKAGDYCLSW